MSRFTRRNRRPQRGRHSIKHHGGVRAIKIHATLKKMIEDIATNFAKKAAKKVSDDAVSSGEHSKKSTPPMSRPVKHVPIRRMSTYNAHLKKKI